MKDQCQPLGRRHVHAHLSNEPNDPLEPLITTLESKPLLLEHSFPPNWVFSHLSDGYPAFNFHHSSIFVFEVSNRRTQKRNIYTIKWRNSTNHVTGSRQLPISLFFSTNTKNNLNNNQAKKAIVLLAIPASETHYPLISQKVNQFLQYAFGKTIGFDRQGIRNGVNDIKIGEQRRPRRRGGRKIWRVWSGVGAAIWVEICKGKRWWNLHWCNCSWRFGWYDWHVYCRG